MKRKIFIKLPGLLFLIGIGLVASGQHEDAFIGGIDANGNSIVISANRDTYYDIELLPQKSFTGSWYFWTTAASSSADLSENPPVDWLEISPAQFTDYGDGIATKVDYHFTVPEQTGVYTTVINDLNGNWGDMYITLTVNRNPNPTVIWDRIIPTQTQFNIERKYQTPAYFYWESGDQYFYFDDCILFETYKHGNLPWFTIDPEVICLNPGDSTIVGFTAYLPSPAIDSILVVKKVRYYAYPVYYKFCYNAQILSVSRPVNLFSGWNLIGYSLSSPSIPEEAFALLINADVLDMVTGYLQGGLYYDPNGPPYLNTLNEIKTGYGYWVKVNTDYPDFSFPVPVSK